MLGFPRTRRPPPARRKRALLAWEFGSGRTHVLDLVGAAKHLRRAGFDCLGAIYDPGFTAEFAALGIPVVQTYVWPGWRRSGVPWPTRPARTLGDLLANFGFADPRSLAAAITHYDALFSLFSPDVVVCDSAYAALLAARARCPAVVIGSAQTVPPTFGGGFPPYDPAAPAPSWSPEEVVAGINGGLARTGRFPIERLSDVMQVEAVCPFGPDPFDAFLAYRTTPLLPPHIPGFRDPPSSASQDEVFVYLHAFVQKQSEVFSALLQVQRPMRVYIPGLTAENRAALTQAGIAVEDEAVELAEILTRSRCVVHHGGPQLTTACLAVGLPQVVLAKELNNRLALNYVRERQLGTGSAALRATSEWVVAEIRRAYDDGELRARCRTQAPQHRRWLDVDPTELVAERICSLVGVPSG